MREVVVVGAGLHRYGVFPDKSAIALGTAAIQRALDDAGCQWTDIDAVYCLSSYTMPARLRNWHELDTGHYPMLSQPEALTRLLLA